MREIRERCGNPRRTATGGLPARCARVEARESTQGAGTCGGAAAAKEAEKETDQRRKVMPRPKLGEWMFGRGC